MANSQLHTSPYRPAGLVDYQSRADRKAALWLLALPLMVLVVMFAFAVFVTVGESLTHGSAKFFAAAFSYVYLAASAMAMPGYLVGVIWFWWRTKADHERITAELWKVPLIAAAFSWFPSTLYPGVATAERINLFVMMVFVVGGASLAWICAVRGYFYLWRKI